jgi:hypothetical protein
LSERRLSGGATVFADMGLSHGCRVSER